MGERRIGTMLLLGASCVVLLFSVLLPTRVASWGAIVIKGERAEASAMCAEVALSAQGRRALPIAPAVVMSADGRYPSAGLECREREEALTRLASTRFPFDTALGLAVKLVPAALLLLLPAGRWIFPVALLPFAWDAASSRVWADAGFIFAGQHVYVAKNLALYGVYGWNAAEMLSYGFPAAAPQGWGIGEAPASSGWTYPGYTLLLAAVYALAGATSPEFLTRIAIGLNLVLVVAALWLLYGALAAMVSRWTAAVLVFIACLSGWAWALCPFAASEPLQALIDAGAVYVALRMPACRALVVLAALCALGHLTKPLLGLVPPAAMLAYVLLERRREIDGLPRHGAIAAAVFAAPLAAWGVRMYLAFGAILFGSTVGNLFLAQSLDPAMTLPGYFGSSELAYGQASGSDVSRRFAALLEDEAYRGAIVQLRWSLLLPSLSGLNYVAEMGRMGNGPYSGVGLALFAMAIAVLPWTRGAALAAGLGILATIAALALTQPLGRYFAPLVVLYPVVLASWIQRGAPRVPLAIAAALAGGMLAAYARDGWL